jgi:streptogramin lyase
MSRAGQGSARPVIDIELLGLLASHSNKGGIVVSHLLVSNRKPGCLTVCLMLLAVVLLGCVLPQPASANGTPNAAGATSTPEAETETGTTAASRAHELGYSLTPSTTEPYAACPLPKPGFAQCAAIVIPPGVAPQSSPLSSLSGSETVSPGYEGGGVGGDLDPTELREAYGISETGGAGQTVAIVDAFNDPDANSDLKEYRKHYGLPECSEENGCFKKVNQEGKAENYPENSEYWSFEMSIDVDMVSAMCPECHILLVESDENYPGSMDAAEDEAASWTEAVTEKKATEIGNSWYAQEGSEESSRDKYFEHKGIPITAAAGDYGYDTCLYGPGLCYPAASKDVISVGGTALAKTEKTEKNPRGWEETVWPGSGGGCSKYEKKSEWQEGYPDCPEGRIDNDVAVEGSGVSAVSVYDSNGYGGWLGAYGTSVGTQIVSGIEAHASKAVREEGAEAFYRHKLFDVTSGRSGYCGGTYLCNAEEGYDAPTGWGAPDGPLELSAGYHAVTGEAPSVTTTTATLTGYVDPEGLATTYHFEYGPTTSYGKTVPVPNGEVGSGVVWKAVSQSITGLEEDRTYHYRLVATNSSGTVSGQDHTFATIPWTVQTTPTPTGTTAETYDGYLYGTSCSSSTACTAVGSYKNSSNAEVTLADRWNGTAWSVQSTPNPEGGTENKLLGVSCASSTACIAVGYYYDKKSEALPLTEQWSSEKWSVQSPAIPEGAKGSKLLAVSCTSSTACTAVGKYYTKEKSGIPEYLMLAERWNGEKWSIQSTPNPEGATASELQSVSCTTVESCTAVGSDTNSAKKAVGLAERWNGKEWSSQEISAVPGLDSVSCTSTEACTAVEGLTAERWNGKEWSTEAMANPVAADESDRYGGSSMNGVSCSSVTQCVAVGSLDRENEETTAAEVWNGMEWSVQRASRPRDGILYGISCPSTTACTSVGSESGYQIEDDYDHFVTLAESATLPPIGKPSVETKAATSVTETGATLNGTVNPEGVETEYYFEYGTTESYGKTTAKVSVGFYRNKLEESKTVTGLTAGKRYHFRIVATNALGTTDGTDHTFGPPENTVLPVASPTTPDQAVPESTTTGTWIGEPTSYSYQWERCNATGGECKEISGATSSKYTPVSEDVAHTLVVKVTAKNSAGSNSASSKETNKVEPIGKITEYSLPAKSAPIAITAGPDGNLWYTDAWSCKIGKITTAGKIEAEYALPKESEPYNIRQGPDGNLWFVDRSTSKIGKITTSGEITEYALPVSSKPEGITAGPEKENALWFTDTGTGKVGKITTSGTITEYTMPGERSSETQPTEITVGSDGNLWVTEFRLNKIAKVTTSGTITEYALPKESEPYGITTGPDGNVWFIDEGTTKIGKITTSGTITEYALPKESGPVGIVTGPDGNLWVTEWSTDKIARVTTSGTITQYSLPGVSEHPQDIAVGPDDNLWFALAGTKETSNGIGKITP